MPGSHADAPLLAPPPQALSLRNRAGERYQRLLAVERELDELLHLRTHSALTARIEQRNHAAPEFVREESIAYFLRAWHGTQQTGARDWLVRQTLDRIDGFIHAHLYALSDVDRENAYGDVVERVFGTILDLERPRGEYYQVRFWNALHRRCIDRFEHYHQFEKDAQIHGVANPRDWDEDNAEDVVNQIPDATAQVEREVVSREELRQVMWRLRHLVTPEQLEAYILRKVDGWPIEGAPGPTLSERYGKTPRTINNWHRTVERAVASLSGGTA